MNVWTLFKDLIFKGLESLQYIVGDWGLAIILLTILFRLLVAPIMHKQIKSTFMMQKIQPQITELQAKYKDDPMRMQNEMQKLYADVKFNPLAGCLPLLLQMPIFMAMFQMLREISGKGYTFYSLVSDLTVTPKGAFGNGLLEFIPYLILMLVFALATFLPMILQNLKSDSKQRSQMLLIGGVMTIMMIFISWQSPAGVLLFWGVSSIIGIFQQQITQTVLRKQDDKVVQSISAEENNEIIDIKPLELNVERKVKKKKPTKKSK